MARKHSVIRLASAFSAGAALWLAWAQTQTPAQLGLEKVTDNLYMITGSGGNVGVMPTPDGVILVDDKFVQDNPQIVAKVKQVTDKPIRYVLNTHQHGDHTGGNAPLLAVNAEIVIHKNARANMAAGNMPGIPRITFSEETQVFLGGKEVVARHFGRGHTNGDAIIYFPSERAIHTGDLFTANAPFCDTNAHCSIKEWDETLKRALAWDFDKVIPGHGPVMTKADLLKYAQNIASMRERVRKACGTGTPEEIVKKLDFSDLGWGAPSAMFARGLPGMCKELQ